MVDSIIHTWKNNGHNRLPPEHFHYFTRSEVPMSLTTTTHTKAIIGEPEVVEDASTAESSDAWKLLKDAAIAIRPLQIKDGSIPEKSDHDAAAEHVAAIVAGIRSLAPAFPHDADYLDALVVDFQRWADGGFGVPDFLDSLMAFQPQQHRIDGIRHLVVFPMYTQNGSTERLVEALIVETIWPEFIAELEAGDYGNKLFVSLRLIDFTPGYDTNSAVLFPETVAMREIPSFTWGRSSRTGRPPATAASCARHPRSPSSTCPPRRRGCWRISPSPRRRS
ncbi:hypothetical protein GCM10025863_31670 [Microbacterium suwonense]|uniref:Uncharacterized protein n=1 Tax=Microbacterium suwonense TaxID=683047 RepID=A0ABN6XAT1_9MICO|nr:hypothetical protein GCM10025863_31670 [Microbacterium suwonense]